MQDTKRDEIFERHQGLVHKLAKKFAVKYCRPIDEMIGEAQYGIVHCISRWKDYDPTKGAESTWVYQWIYYTLLDSVTNRKHIQTIPLMNTREEEDTEEIEYVAKDKWIDTLLREVGEEGAFLVRTIIDAPAEILNEMAPSICARARNAVIGYLVDELDWDKQKLKRAWKEVQECLSAQG